MSTKFDIPEWLSPQPTPPPPPVDDHRIEGLVNRFIAGKQEALFTAPDAFYRGRGGDAIDGAPAIADRLEALIRRAAELEHDNDDKIAGLADAQASAARELARLDGVAPDSPKEADILNGGRSQILRAAIEQRIGAARPDHAVTLYDRVKAVLSPADRRALELPIGAATDDAATGAWLARETATDGPPLSERAGLDDGLSDTQRLILLARISARDSAEQSRRFATVKGLDDRLAEATATIATQPALYRPGTLSALAEAYADAGAPEKADETRWLALQEAYFLPFAQAGAAAQQRHLQDLAGPERAMAEAILRHQDAAFAHDPYAAGTALYPEVGPPLSKEDTEGRLKQVRMIEAMRSNSIQAIAQDGPTEATDASPPPAGALFNASAPSDREAPTPETSPTSVSLNANSADVERPSPADSNTELAALPIIGRPDNDNRTPDELCRRAFDDMKYELNWGYDSSGNLLTPNDKKLWIERGVEAREDCLRIARNGFIPRDGAYVHYPGGGVIIFRPNRAPIYVPPPRYRPPR